MERERKDREQKYWEMDIDQYERLKNWKNICSNCSTINYIEKRMSEIKSKYPNVKFK